MNKAQHHYDALIVGGGVVGFAAALGLAKQQRRVLLLERAAQWHNVIAQPSENTAIDTRVFAISHASECLLSGLGVWHAIKQWRACAYKTMHVWDAQAEGHIEFGADDILKPHLGHIVENSVIVSACWQQAQSSENITLKTQATVRHIEASDEHVHTPTTVTLESGEQYTTDLLVVADGAQSRTRQALNIAMRKTSYEQRAIVATVSTSQSHQYTAWQRFLPTGPLAFLPLSNGQCSIVWSADNNLSDTLMNQADDRFMSSLSTAFEHRLGQVTEVSQRHTFDLYAQHADDYVRRGVVLVGDAAHQIHPLAGQGVNLGLLDVATLLEEVSCYAALTAFNPLRRYARRRRHANTITQQSMTGFYQVFKTHPPEFNRLRASAMTWVGQQGALRRQFAMHAAGLAGDIPEQACADT